MGKRIKINKKIILIIIGISVLLIGYYTYDKSINTYSELEIEAEEDLIAHEETVEKIKEEADEIGQEETQGKGETIMVHITGEVKQWGVIELEQGSRIIDAVNKAGGFTESADYEKVNLAYVLEDGLKVYIPNKDEKQESNITTQEYITEGSGDNVIMEESEMKKTSNSLVNINNATQTELETLPGIGPSIALKIIAYREDQGKFLSIEDIKNVSGIGDNKFESIRELICI